jgi:RNA polymerase sigma-70 factor (ECF subfamily)
MNRTDWLAEHFEQHRPRLRAVAYRMLGSLSEADDVLQDAWVRLSRTDATEIDSLGAWLTTVVARVALNVLRTRRSRHEQSLELRLPDPIVEAVDGTDPENAALLADSVGLAMLVVLDTLTPAERLAYVLHDMFAMPFEDIARVVGRSPAATRQLASRARRRVRGSGTMPDRDLDVQWRAAEAFQAAARDGDFKALLEILDPEVVLRADFGPGVPGRSVLLRGAQAVAKQADFWARVDLVVHRVLVNGGPGVVLMVGERLFSVGAVTVKDGKIVELDFFGDPERLARLDLEFLGG